MAMETRDNNVHDQPANDADGIARQPEPTYLGPAELDKLCGLVFELAGQVHELRARVAHLEAADDRTDTVDAPGIDDELRRAVDGLMAVLLESDDIRQPLRADVTSPDRPPTPGGSSQ